MTYCVLDYGVGNLTSVLNALKEIEVDFRLHENGEIPNDVSGLIIPGVARYRSGITNLKRLGFFEQIVHLHGKGLPILGLCLGAQMLGFSSEEDPEVSGLSMINFNCKQLNNKVQRVPFQGWKAISTDLDIFDIYNKYYYFSHKFEMNFDENETAKIAYVKHSESEVVGMFVKENLVGIQFHPEKSGAAGLELLTEIFQYYSNI